MLSAVTTGGLTLKQLVIRLVAEAGHSYEDFGCYSKDPVDYPDIAVKVAEAVARGDFDRGILICGTGIGMCIAANKVKGIRAAQCYNVFSARRARQHNDANICCLAGEEGKHACRPSLKPFSPPISRVAGTRRG